MTERFGATTNGEGPGSPDGSKSRTQAQEVMTDRMALVGMLVAGLAHEMNNPLASVIANLELAELDVAELLKNGNVEELGEALRQELHHAREAAERVRQILGDLRAFSRADHEEPSPVDVARIMDAALRIARNEIRYRARVVREYERVSPVLATETGLTQAFLSIVSAATSALEEGDLESNEIRVGIRDEQGQVVVEIGHTGHAAPQDDAQSSHPSLGGADTGGSPSIPISQRLVSGFGGSLQVIEQASSGVTFRVSLPPLPNTVHQEVPLQSSAVYGMRRGRVLVVVEDVVNARAIRRVLEKEHDVSIGTAKEAVAQIASGQSFDVILCDLMMPGMTGMDLFSELNGLAVDQAKNMVFLTGEVVTPKARVFLQTVQNQCLEKPFDTAQLRAVVRRRLA